MMIEVIHFDIHRFNDGSDDEPYVWTVFAKFDDNAVQQNLHNDSFHLVGAPETC
jgi:hypothetical protein